VTTVNEALGKMYSLLLGRVIGLKMDVLPIVCMFQTHPLIIPDNTSGIA